MRNKLQNQAQKSKLQDLGNDKRISSEKVVALRQKTNSTLRAFRLDDQTWQDLQATVEKINNHSQRKPISASRLIKALIYLGKQAEEDKLIKALKESSF